MPLWTCIKCGCEFKSECVLESTIHPQVDSEEKRSLLLDTKIIMETTLSGMSTATIIIANVTQGDLKSKLDVLMKNEQCWTALTCDHEYKLHGEECALGHAEHNQAHDKSKTFHF
jgi:hypothetical protein